MKFPVLLRWCLTGAELYLPVGADVITEPYQRLRITPTRADAQATVDTSLSDTRTEACTRLLGWGRGGGAGRSSLLTREKPNYHSGDARGHGGWNRKKRNWSKVGKPRLTRMLRHVEELERATWTRPAGARDATASGLLRIVTPPSADSGRSRGILGVG